MPSKTATTAVFFVMQRMEELKNETQMIDLGRMAAQLAIDIVVEAIEMHKIEKVKNPTGL